MQDTLGILVTSDKHFNYVINLTETACNKGKKVNIFFTGKAVKLIESPDFSRLSSKASLAICDWSAHSLGLSKPLPDIDPGIFEPQTRHAEIMKDCDRYVVF